MRTTGRVIAWLLPNVIAVYLVYLASIYIFHDHAMHASGYAEGLFFGYLFERYKPVRRWLTLRRYRRWYATQRREKTAYRGNTGVGDQQNA